MTKMRRINYIIQGLLILLVVGVLLIDPEDGYVLILAFLSISFLVYGINQLLFYFTLAKYMVGGKYIICKAIAVLDLGLEAAALTEVPKMYVMIYLVAGLVFGGFIDVLRAMDTRKREGRRWKVKLLQGIITIVIALAGLFFVNSTHIVVYFFCFGAVSLAFTRIVEAFRDTTIV